MTCTSLKFTAEATGTLYAVACGQLYGGSTSGACTLMLNSNVTTAVTIEGTCSGCNVQLDVVAGLVSSHNFNFKTILTLVVFIRLLRTTFRVLCA